MDNKQNKPITYDELYAKVTKFIKKTEELDVINAAYGFALEKHSGRKRINGDDYITHPIEVANILTDLNEIADITGIMAEKEEDPKVKALETSIDDMEFSVRAYNCLKRSGINTMQDLVNRKESDMMKIRNLGKKSLKEVLDKVKAMGLSFKNDD